MLAKTWATIALALCASGCNGFFACSDYPYARSEDLVTPCVESGSCTLSGAVVTPGDPEAVYPGEGFGYLDVAPQQSIAIPVPSTHPRFALQPRLVLSVAAPSAPAPSTPRLPGERPRNPPPSPEDLHIAIDGVRAHCVIAHVFDSEDKYACTLPEGAKTLELVYDPASADPSPSTFSVSIYLEEEIPTAEYRECAV